MGLSHSSKSLYSNFDIREWRQVAIEKNYRILENVEMRGSLIEEHPILISQNTDFELAKEILELRKEDMYLVNVYHYFPTNQERIQGLLYSERIPIRLDVLQPLSCSDILHLTFQMAIGCEKLSKYFGYFLVDKNCLGVNCQNVIKVWHNPDFSCIYPAKQTTIQMMIESIIRIVEFFDNSKIFFHFLLTSKVINFDSLKNKIFEYASIYNFGEIPKKLTFWQSDSQNMCREKNISNCICQTNSEMKNNEYSEFYQNRDESFACQSKPNSKNQHKISMRQSIMNKIKTEPKINITPNSLSFINYEKIETQTNLPLSTQNLGTYPLVENKIPKKQVNQIIPDSTPMCVKQINYMSPLNHMNSISKLNQPVLARHSFSINSKHSQMLATDRERSCSISPKKQQNNIVFHYSESTQNRQTINLLPKPILSFRQTPEKVQFVCQQLLKVESENLKETEDEGYKTPYFVPNESKMDTFGQEHSKQSKIFEEETKNMKVSPVPVIKLSKTEIAGDTMGDENENTDFENNIGEGDMSPIAGNTPRALLEAREEESINFSAREFFNNSGEPIDDYSQVVSLCSPLDYRLANKEPPNMDQIDREEEVFYSKSEASSKEVDDIDDGGTSWNILENMKIIENESKPKEKKMSKKKEFHREIANLGFGFKSDGSSSEHDTPSSSKSKKANRSIVMNAFNKRHFIEEEEESEKEKAKKKAHKIKLEMPSLAIDKLASLSTVSPVSEASLKKREGEEIYKFEWDPELLADLRANQN